MRWWACQTGYLGCLLLNMADDVTRTALAELDRAAAVYVKACRARDRAMAELKAKMLAADAVGVARLVIIEHSTLAKGTAYTVFPVVRPSR
jgi:hypothetical protein